jgi:two-component system, NtrC family, sensor histidine kinase HydH
MKPGTHDIGWILFFAAVAWFGPIHTVPEATMLTLMAIFQLLEPRVAAFATPRGTAISIVIKFALCYLLIGYTDGISSSYYFMLLIPILAAATTQEALIAGLLTVMSSLSYLSFVLFLGENEYISEDQWHELFLRIASLCIVGFAAYQLAAQNRIKARDAEANAEKLVIANASLQAAEDAVRRADRLAALGQLTAGLAHELRNPLATIKSSSELLNKTLPEGNEVAKEVAGFISTEVDRTNSLITRFLEFARPLKLKLAEVDVTTVIDTAVRDLQRHMKTQVHRNYSPDVRPVALDAELMERVFYNLLQNAAQASPADAGLTVRTRRLDGNSVEVAVIDRGAGIAAANLENIFNPFFTTKTDGVGLGLAIVSKIVDEHGGRILVESDPGNGTIFRVILPERTA